MSSPFLNLIKNAVNKVKENNRVDPNVKTADASVFEMLVEKMKKKPEAASTNERPLDVFDKLEAKVTEVQQTNEADPNVETADSSVFEQMKRELEALKSQVAEQEARANAPVPPAPPAASTHTTSHSAGPQVMAVTDSGGALQIRATPDMGAPTKNVLVPDSSLIRVVEYSDKGIILDGKESKFVLIEFEGQQGWILDSYLNFN